MAKDPTMNNILLVLALLVGFIFSILSLAFSADITLFSFAIKHDIFWVGDIGYTNVAENAANSSIALIPTIYHAEADLIETDMIAALTTALRVVSIAASLITLILIVIIFFKKDGGLIQMFKTSEGS